MKTETEIKIILRDTNIEKLINKIEKVLNVKKTPVFHQTTHQFFLEDYTKQNSFPRIRNEEDGRNTLTLKVKIPENTSQYFKRIELEVDISNPQTLTDMMPFFGYPKKVTWEKRRINFKPVKNSNFKISLDETPMGYFLEIESTEGKIEKIIEALGLTTFERTKKAYLGVWEEYNKKRNQNIENMMFNDN